MEELAKIIKKMSNIEKAITTFAVALLVAIQFNTGGDLLSFMTAMFGIVYVLGVKYKYKYTPLIGIVQCSIYSAMAYSNAVYGDVFLNIYNVAFLVFGFIQWSKNNKDGEVEVRKLSGKGKMALGVITVLVYTTMFIVLSKLGGFTPYLDALNTTFSCIAMALLSFRYVEQWVFWNIVNISSVILYASLFLKGGNVLPVVVMFVIYLLNSLHAYYIWNKKNK